MKKLSKLTSKKPLYKKKRKTDKGYVWEYDEKTIKEREKEKASKRKTLENNIEKLRKQYKKDLSSDDLRTRAIAAVVSIMDECAMRVGNEPSAKDGTFGATTLKKKHITFSVSKAKLNFVGKAGVKQSQEVSDSKTISVLKELVKDKKADDFVFEVDNKKIWDRSINRYLLPFHISAKDIRGFHSNRMMKEKLKKKDYDEALKEVAKEIGHEAKTLEKNYLDPKLVEKYKKASISKTALLAKYQPILEELERKYKGQTTATGVRLVELSPENKAQLNIKPRVRVSQPVLIAWKALVPHLPAGAKMTSGFRGPEDQKRILRNYWYEATRQRIPKEQWGNLEMWKEISRRLKGYGYYVGPPVLSKSPYSHGKGNAFDVAGADLDEIARAVKKVSDDPSIPVKMRYLIERKNRDVHVNVIQVSAYANAETDDFVKTAHEDLIASNPPAEILAEFEEVFGLVKEAGKYEEEKSDPKWQDVLIDKDGKKLTRKQIRDHYVKYADKILKDIKGKDVLIYIAPKKNQAVLKRNENDKPIRINNKEELVYYADRRLLSIHKIFNPKNKNGVIDLDPHGNFSRSEMIKFAKKLKSILKSKLGVSAEIWESGGEGLHLEFVFGSEKDVDNMRAELKKICEEASKGSESITTGLVKGTGLRCDTSIYHDRGSVRAKWSLGEKTGRIKKPLGGGKTASFSFRHIAKVYDEAEAEEVAENSPDVFLTDYVSSYPQFKERALENLAIKQPVAYFAVFKFHKKPEYASNNKVALYSLLAKRPDIYFTQDLYKHPEFEKFHRLAAYYTANIAPRFFLDILLKVMPEHEEFREVAERRLKKTAGKIDYPEELYNDIVLWLDGAIFDMFNDWLAEMRWPKKHCQEFELDLFDTELYKRYKDKILAIQKAGLYNSLTICIEPRRSKNGIEALYQDHYGRPTITLFGGPEHISETPEGTEDPLEDTHTALRHELTHLVQAILEAISGKDAGLPTKKHPKERDYDATQKIEHEKYLGSDIEFFPLIANLETALKRDLNSKWALDDEEIKYLEGFPDAFNGMTIDFGQMSTEHKLALMRHRFARFIEKEPFIQLLKRSPNRYKKMVRELYRVFDSITKNASISKRASLYGGWISPHGEFFPVEHEGHIDFIDAHPEIFGELGPDYFTQALDKGWLRLFIGRNFISIDIPAKEDKYITRIQKILSALPIKEGIQLYWGGERAEVYPYSAFVASYGFGDLERYNKYASISKRADRPYGYWLAPDGTLYPVQDAMGHAKFVWSHPELFGEFDDIDILPEDVLSKGWVRIVNRSHNKMSIEFPAKDDKYIARVQNADLPRFQFVDISWPFGWILNIPYSAFMGAFGFRDLEKYKTASLSKRSALLDYPHKTYEEMAKYLSEWIKDAIIEGPKIEYQDEEFPDLKTFTRKFKEFPLDLTDIEQYKKHKWFREGVGDILTRFDTLGLHFVAGNENDFTFQAYWETPSISLHFDIEDLHKDYNGLNEKQRSLFLSYYVSLAKSILRHELTHLTQHLMEMAKEKGMGLPGKYNPKTYQMYGMNPKIQKKYKELGSDLRHTLSDKEFFPILQDVISMFDFEVFDEHLYRHEYEWLKGIFPDLEYEAGTGLMGLVPQARKTLLNKRFKKYVGGHERLNRFLQYAPEKYQKAMREIYRAFDEGRQKFASLSKRAQAPEIKLDETEKKIFDLLNEVVDYYKLPVELYVAGGWARDKLLENMRK